MLPRIKSLYRRAAFWAAVIVIPSYLAGLYAVPNMSMVARLNMDYIRSNPSHALVLPAYSLFLLQTPGITTMKNLRRSLMYGNLEDPNPIGPFVPVLNWLIYFGGLLRIFYWRDRHAARKQFGETPRTT